MFLKLAVVTSLVTLSLSATYNAVENLPTVQWDFIIVGGGTAGSVLASRLTENPRFNVLVLEAGPTNENVTSSIIPGFQLGLPNTRYDWNYTSIPQLGLNNRSLSIQRGYILGGSSSVNGMMYVRGSSSDYDRFAEYSEDPGWSWDNIQQYLRKNEKLEDPVDNHNTTGRYDLAVHSATGRVPVTLAGFSQPQVDSLAIQASEQLGGDFKYNIDMNSGTPLGLGWLQSTIGHDGTRSSAATAYLDDDTRARENLHIVTSARVTRVLPSANVESLTIRTVEVHHSDVSSPVKLTASKEVILCGGTIGSPLILMHSGIGNAGELKDIGIEPLLDNPSVGHNLTDHPLFSLAFSVAPDSLDLGAWGNLFTDPAVQAEALEIWNKNRTGPYVDYTPIGQIIAWTRIAQNITESLGDPSSGPNSAHFQFLLGALSPDAYSVVVLLVSPASRGTISIGSNDPFDEPMINPGFFAAEFDIVAAREAFKTALKFSRAPVFRDVITGIMDPFTNVTTDAEIDRQLRNITASGLHPVGTSSMSPKGASWGVVDPDLSVKNIQGLRIVDASVMPFVPCANTQVATYMIAERAAELIRSSWE